MELLANIVISTNKKIVKKNGCWAISNLCRGDPKPPVQIIIPGFKAIAIILGSKIIDDKEIISDCMWVLYYGTEESADLMNFLINTNGIF